MRANSTMTTLDLNTPNDLHSLVRKASIWFHELIKGHLIQPNAYMKFFNPATDVLELPPKLYLPCPSGYDRIPLLRDLGHDEQLHCLQLLLINARPQAVVGQSILNLFVA
jgi:hypothetical protein